MIKTKNFRASINGNQPDMIKLSFPDSKTIKAPLNAHYPYFTSLELDHLDNRQKELEQTNVKGSGFKTVKKIVKKNSEKLLDKAKDKAQKELKKQAKNQVDNLIGHLQSNNELEGGKLHLKKMAKKAHVGRKLKNVGKNVVLPVAKEAAKTALKDGAMALAESNPELMPLLPVANTVIDKSIGSGIKPKKVNKRAEIVKKIMKDKGLSMISASKYVKTHNLYKK
jgi:hypothetical protein